MKRTNLVLDPTLLEKARRLLGAKTYSETVNMALTEAVRVQEVRGLHQFMGSKLWEGDLNLMREDKPRQRRSRKVS